MKFCKTHGYYETDEENAKAHGRQVKLDEYPELAPVIKELVDSNRESLSIGQSKG